MTEPGRGGRRRWWRATLVYFGLVEGPNDPPSVRGRRGDDRVVALEERLDRLERELEALRREQRR